jgi:hypothetical protein
MKLGVGGQGVGNYVLSQAEASVWGQAGMEDNLLFLYLKPTMEHHLGSHATRLGSQSLRSLDWLSGRAGPVAKGVGPWLCNHSCKPVKAGPVVKDGGLCC